jgi:hypothetical protein
MSEVTEILAAMQRNDWGTAVPRARRLPVGAFPEIAGLLGQSKDLREQELLYKILIHVAVSSRSPEVGTFAAGRAGIETNVKLLIPALEAAGWTRGITLYQPIIQALSHKNRDVQRWAIQALGACQGEEAEKALLATFNGRATPGTGFYAMQALSRMCGPDIMGELEGIFPTLPRQKSDESTLVHLIFCLARHPRASSTALVRQELETTQQWKVGWASLNYLFNHGDASDAERVSNYLQGLCKRLKRGTAVYDYRHALLHLRAPFPTELTAALATLRKFGADPIGQYSGDIRAFWKSLSYHDHVWLLTTYPDEFTGLTPHPAP